jgi:uncharacterized membrane protein (DUF485 family)
MDLRSPVVKEKEDAAVVAHNARIGLVLFAAYTAIYGGFMLLSAFEPQLMSKPFLGGVNLAVVYGFALIAAAIVVALVYLKLCRKS